ncbi:MAG: glucose-1-phosphate adenylyltransferase subunit GlgD [Clostridia bacterium]|nr:glucose-1-phosphate adenylyltransferase subunit GlgD [Clostridia bacterium]
MRTQAVAGIVFANSHDECLEPLTRVRSMASLPFGGRFRLIDFALSSFVNANITNVGILVKSNYRSLMDHIENGVSWDLDRKIGGIRLMPPYNEKSMRRYDGYIEALYGAVEFIKRCNSDNVVLYDGCVVGNIDLGSALDFHNEKDADITVLYKKIDNYKNDIGAMTFSYDLSGRITNAAFPKTFSGTAATSFGVIIFKRSVLLPLLTKAYQEGKKHIERDIIAENLNCLKVYAVEHKGFAAVMDSRDAYYKANMALLKDKIRNDIFVPSRPVFTKIRDDMPTRFGINSKVSNSLFADGCVIEGTVKNSILFRGVKVEKGAVVENSILMQGVTVGKNAKISYVVSDKNVEFEDNKNVIGTEDKVIFTEKNHS